MYPHPPRADAFRRVMLMKDDYAKTRAISIFDLTTWNRWSTAGHDESLTFTSNRYGITRRTKRMLQCNFYVVRYDRYRRSFAKNLLSARLTRYEGRETRNLKVFWLFRYRALLALLITSPSANGHYFQHLFSRLTNTVLLFSLYRSSENSKARSTCASSYRRWPRFVNPLDKSQVGTRSVGGLRRIGKPSSVSRKETFIIVINTFALLKLFEKFMSRYS